MSDEHEIPATIDTKEEAFRLKTLAEEKYNSGDLNSAVTFANRARDLYPSISGLPEMLKAFEILRAAAVPALESTPEKQKPTPDYYRILQVQRFSHIDLIKKQYKKLALTLHPDKNPFQASAEAFKLVGEAARVLSDRIRRKEYDTRLRIVMQSEAAQAVALGPEDAVEAFSTVCSACRSLHRFERKYLGHHLMCPSCKKTFKATEVKDGVLEKNDEVGGGRERVSARLQERVAKGGYVGIVEKSGLAVKRRKRNVGEVLEKSRTKVARSSGVGGVKSDRVDIVAKYLDIDSAVDDVENCRFKKMETLINENGNGRVGGGVEEVLRSREVEIMDNKRSKSTEAGEDESMTLSQLRMMMKKKKKKKKKPVDGKLTTKVEGVDAEKFKVNEEEEIERGLEKEKAGEEESMEEIENVREEERAKEREEKAEEATKLSKKSNRRRVPEDKNLEAVNETSKSPIHSENDRSSAQGNLEVLLEKGKETGATIDKRERYRVSKCANSDISNMKSSKDHMGSDIVMLIASKKGEVEIMPVEDSNFHDFNKDRRERRFKKGQVWAVYDDDDGMPRQYALVNEIVSVNPFEVTLSWLQLRSNGDEELVNCLEKGFHVSCGIFQVTQKVTIKYLNLFSHLVDCERAARESYRIYPKKGSVWAVYNNSSGEGEERSQGIEVKRCYSIVVSLSSYNDIHGLSIAYLEKVSGFRNLYKRREIGANSVVSLGASEIKRFSHQIPAKKLSCKDSSGLPKDCWELDPASLTPQLLTLP